MHGPHEVYGGHACQKCAGHAPERELAKHRAWVFKLGSQWFWRCRGLRCSAGGVADSPRGWDTVMGMANEHVRYYGAHDQRVSR